MRTVFLSSLVFLTVAITRCSSAPGDDDKLICINDAIPSIVVELPYATKNNFLKKKLYPNHRAYLLKSVAKRLADAQAELQKEGLGLKVWDGYRPLSVQREFWKVMPDSRYVANPTRGSRHNRGAAVDVTLVDASGKELPMPSSFDDFTPCAAAYAPTETPEQAANRGKLQDIMTKHKFQILESEWWHFDALGWEKYPILDIPLVDLDQPLSSKPQSAHR